MLFLFVCMLVNKDFCLCVNLEEVNYVIINVCIVFFIYLVVYWFGDFFDYMYWFFGDNI